MSEDREIIRWVTVQGKHFPIYKDEDGNEVFGVGKEEFSEANLMAESGKELLKKAYDKCANAIIKTLHQPHSFKNSGLNFRVYEGARQDNWQYQIQFEKAIDMGVGTYSQFNFKTKEDLGRFLFETGANSGWPKGSKH